MSSQYSITVPKASETASLTGPARICDKFMSHPKKRDFSARMYMNQININRYPSINSGWRIHSIVTARYQNSRMSAALIAGSNSVTHSCGQKQLEKSQKRVHN
jgi:hypothetical protein